MPTKVVLDLSEVAIQEVLQDDVGKSVVKTTIKVLNRGKVLCPVDTGNLRASHQMRIWRRKTMIGGEVFTHVKYALPVHDGRRAITIYPKTKKALAFVWHGQKFVRKSVHQKARKGRPWLRTALQEVAAQEGYQITSRSIPETGS